MTSQGLRQVAISLLSGIAGVGIGAALVAKAWAPHREPTRVPSDAPASAVERSSLELAGLSGRVRALEQSAAASHVAPREPEQAGQEHDAPVPSAVPPPEPPTPEQSRERATRIRNEQLTRFADEAVDPAWARPTAAALQSDIDALAPTIKASASTVDCRMSMCKGTLKWPSYAVASGNLTAILRAPYRKNCATVVTLPEPDDRSAPYEGNVFFDCTRDRTE